MTPDCSKMLLRIAVPPPQQKFFPFSSSMVTTGAFHAASSAVGRLPRLGSSQRMVVVAPILTSPNGDRSEEHTSELQSHSDLVCRLLLEKKKKEKKRVLESVNERQI